MNELFIPAFVNMFEALLRIFIIILLAGILVRKKIITTQQIDALSRITVVVLLPALVFSNTLLHFDPKKLSYWWLLPLLGIAMSILGVFIASIVFFKDFKKKKNMIALASMQNAGYLVLPIGQVIYPDHFEAFATLTFLFILGYNPVLWTAGKQLITSSEEKQQLINWKQIITPPAAANLISLLIVLLKLQKIFPAIVIEPIDFLGKAAVPVATFVLGATLGSISLKHFHDIGDIIKVLSVKYILIPLTVMLLLAYFKTGEKYPLLSDFLIIQAAAAPATGLILQVRSYGGNRQKVAETMFIAYIICLLALPFWIAMWHSFQ